MRFSNLEKLWRGIQPLPNLKKIDLSESHKLKEIPNLCKATNLKTLILSECTSLVELPSSIKNLHKLKWLDMSGCVKLRVIPTNINLASLGYVDMSDCSQLTTFPDISSNIRYLDVSNTKIEDPSSVIGRWSQLRELMVGSRSLKRLTHVPLILAHLDLSNSDIKKIPDCVLGLPGLKILKVQNCRKLVSLQGIPPSLERLNANDCGSLKSISLLIYEPRAKITLSDCKCVKSEKDAIRVSSILYGPTREISFRNCLKLDEEARRAIIQRWAYKSVLLPGKEIPAEFTHRATGNSVTISSGTFSASSRFKACLLLSPNVLLTDLIVCRLRSKGVIIKELNYYSNMASSPLLTEHLLVFYGALHICLQADATTSEIQFEFSCMGSNENIIECGLQIVAEEGEISSPSEDPKREIMFLNCLKLGEEARRAIIQRWAYKWVLLPYKEVPAEFTHKAKGNSITISSGTFSASSRFKACLLLSPNDWSYTTIICHLRSKGVLIHELISHLGWYGEESPQLVTEHLFVFSGGLSDEEHRGLKADATLSNIIFEFSSRNNDDKIFECGVQILTEEGESSSSEWKEHTDGAIQVFEDESVVKSSKHTNWWNWFRKLGLMKKKKREPSSRESS